jgi:hypothetical protein
VLDRVFEKLQMEQIVRIKGTPHETDIYVRLQRMVYESSINGNRCCTAERSTTMMTRNSFSLVRRHLYTLSSS